MQHSGKVSIDVDSEVGRLRRVLIHRPGDEIVRMTQHDLAGMLFDDILAPTETQREHDVMVDIMRAAGAEVELFHELLESALASAPDQSRSELLERICECGGAPELAEELSTWPAARLAHGLIAGVYWDEFRTSRHSLAHLRDELAAGRPMALRPIPNLMFMRDPCISVYDHVLVARMATNARAREPLVVAFALRWAASGAGEALEFAEDDVTRDSTFHSLEGGDVLVLSRGVLMIGCSERTTAQTIERLAHEVLFPRHADLQSIYVVMMPHMRSVMHLDTILTQIDRGLFVGHAPMVGAVRSDDALPIACLRRGAGARLLGNATVVDVLREEFGDDVEVVPCGGDDPLFQEREQWTDGANAVCMAPGRILLYARNTHTVAALTKHGFHEIRLAAVLPAEQRAQLVAEGMAAERTVFTFSGSELSRARGGGRCLTMPLVRDRIDR